MRIFTQIVENALLHLDVQELVLTVYTVESFLCALDLMQLGVKDAGFNVYELLEQYFVFLCDFVSITKCFSHRLPKQDCQAAFILPKLIFLKSFAVLIVSIGVHEKNLSSLDNFDQRVYQPYVVDILVPDFLSHSVVQNEEVKKLIQRGIYVVFGFFSDD